MSAPIAIDANVRSELGSRANHRLRKTGQIPGVVYGHHQDVVPIKLDRKSFVTHLSRGAHVFTLSLEGKSEPVLVKDVQFDHLGNDVLHVDFARVDLNERVTITVALELKGEPKGEKEGGVLQQILNELEIECVVTDIPDRIVQDVSGMEKDAVLHVSELKLPAGVTCVTDGELIVATCREVLSATEEPAAVAETGGEPEVITKGKTDEEGDGAAEKK
jgi:large subunit ribosomal protein L25